MTVNREQTRRDAETQREIWRMRCPELLRRMEQAEDRLSRIAQMKPEKGARLERAIEIAREQ